MVFIHTIHSVCTVARVNCTRPHQFVGWKLGFLQGFNYGDEDDVSTIFEGIVDSKKRRDMIRLGKPFSNDRINLF